MTAFSVGVLMDGRARAAAPGAEPPKPSRFDSARRQRVLHLPEDRSLGSVFLQDEAVEEGAGISPSGINGEFWDIVGPATGDVTIPAGKRVWLNVTRPADLSALARLRPDDLDVLAVHGSNRFARLDTGVMPHLQGLTGLKVLRIAGAEVTDRGVRYLRGLRSLEDLGIQLSKSVSRRQTDACMNIIAGLASLETLHLTGYEIADASLAPLARLQSLRRLTLWSPKIYGPGLSHVAEIPSLRYLRVSGSRINDSSTVALGRLTQLKELNLSNLPITDQGVARLSGLTGLEVLNLGNTRVTDPGVAHLRSMTSLKDLNLGKRPDNTTRIGEAGLAHLRAIRSLERLDFSGATDRGLAIVADLPNLKYLRTGDERDQPITDAGLAHLARLQRLEELRLGCRGITDAGMAHIGKLKNLRRLSLFQAANVGNEGLAALRSLESLRDLALLSRTKVTVAGLAQLNALTSLTALRATGVARDGSRLDLSGLKRLEKLSLGGGRECPIGDEDLACLAQLTQLREIQIYPHKTLSDAGLARLAGLTNLQMLNVGGPGITDAGLAHLANMSKMWYLSLTGDITDRGLRHLEGLKALGCLRITSESACSQAAIDRLKRKLPNLGYVKIIP